MLPHYSLSPTAQKDETTSFCSPALDERRELGGEPGHMPGVRWFAPPWVPAGDGEGSGNGLVLHLGCTPEGGNVRRGSAGHPAVGGEHRRLERRQFRICVGGGIINRT
jgi:hypothetical protein